MRSRNAQARIAIALVACLAALAGIAPGDASAKPRKVGLDLRLEHTGIIKRNAYSELPPMRRNGAMGSNARRGGFSLAQQQLGDLWVRAGIVHDKPRAIKRGFRAFDYAFKRQRGDGSFPVDQAEEYAFFVESVAHSLLLLQRTDFRGRFRGRIARYRDKLRKTVPHMVRSDTYVAFKSRNPSYTHSGYSVGTALALSARLLHKRRYLRAGREAIRTALDNQRRNGANPELGGGDVRYQMVGLVYAERYRVYYPGGALSRRVQRMVLRGLRWMDRKVDGDGYIRWRGSTRACRERASDGDPKTPGYSFAVRGFAYWGKLKGRDGYLRIARDLHRYSDDLSPRRQCGPKVRDRRRGGGGGDRRERRGGDRGGDGGGGGLLDDVLPLRESGQLVP